MELKKVSEDPPELRKPVLGLGAHGAYFVGYRVDDCGHFNTISSSCIRRAVYWAELPELPKEMRRKLDKEENT